MVRNYSREEIDQLIRCPKMIVEPPKKELRLERGSKRNDMTLTSIDSELKFTVFMRINADFEENFSIGLEYYPKDEKGSVCLVRCNGPHGEFLGGSMTPSAHFFYHIHMGKAENLEAGLRAERSGEPTKKFASYSEALSVFLNMINAVNVQDHFPNLHQLPLQFEERQEAET